LEVELIQIGDSLDDQLAEEASRAMEREPRYRWLGSVSHSRALKLLASSHAMIISSRMEGGANVVSEAIRIGTPVIASRMSGNVGLLGDRYPGYYPLANERALARRITEVARKRGFSGALKRNLARLRPTVDPRNEARMLGKAIKAVGAIAP
ncbi:MAG TPA: glycosyltransferase, partial [Burkholderiales bacterium]|nr:glycosyltransferase [Burkholderiales bacterium]